MNRHNQPILTPSNHEGTGSTSANASSTEWLKLWRKSWFTAARGCWSIQSLGDARGAHLYILFVIKWRNLTWMLLRQRCIVAFAHRFHYIITFLKPQKTKLQTTQQNNSSGSTVEIKNKKPSDLSRIIHANSSQSGASRLRIILWFRIILPFSTSTSYTSQEHTFEKKTNSKDCLPKWCLANNETLLCRPRDKKFVIMYHRAALNILK